MRNALNVFLERVLQLLIVVGVLSGLTAALLAAGIMTVGFWNEDHRAIAFGIGAALTSTAFLLITPAVLGAQRRIVQRLRAPSAPSTPAT
jgi:hypothetical protein